VLAESASWGYGASGTHGFGGVLVKDRYHFRGHAQYFDPKFVEKYWEPFIKRGEYQATEFEKDIPTTPWRLRVLGVLPLKWLLACVPLLILAYTIGFTKELFRLPTYRPSIQRSQLSPNGRAVFPLNDVLFEDPVIPTNARITGVIVVDDGTIHGLQLVYTENGKEYKLSMHGSPEGKENTFRLGEHEYLTGISGRCEAGLNSITFHTNKRASQRFGGAGGDNSYHLILPKDKEVIGLWGKRVEQTIIRVGLIIRSR
jgi:hypothetical protein